MRRYDELTENGTPEQSLDERLGAIEADIKAIKAQIGHMQMYVDAHEKGVWNLSDRMTREHLDMYDVINDMLAKLNPVYDRVMPALGAFEAEVKHALKRRKP